MRNIIQRLMRRAYSLIPDRLRSIISSAVRSRMEDRDTGPSPAWLLETFLLSSIARQKSVTRRKSDSITCPQCGMTSYNLNDVQSGWCAKCGGVTQDVPGGHLPWTPQSIWDYIDLPDQAYERMAEGGVWRVQEPQPPAPIDRRTMPNRQEYRLVNYKFRAVSFGKAEVLGCWEGSNDWQHVGYAEYIG